jgi:hypothetical protein
MSAVTRALDSGMTRDSTLSLTPASISSMLIFWPITGDTVIYQHLSAVCRAGATFWLTNVSFPACDFLCRTTYTCDTH